MATQNLMGPLITFSLPTTGPRRQEKFKPNLFQRQSLLFFTKSASSGKVFEKNKLQPLSYPFLAGVLDGDGFIRTYKFTSEYEITMHEEDQKLLLQLVSQFGGEVRKVPNKKALRFHLNSKNALKGRITLVELTEGLNSYIRNNIRIEQFKEACNALGLEYLAPSPISLNDGYIAGLFCSDGSIFINCRPSAETRAAAKKKEKAGIPKSFPEKLKFSDPEALENRVQRVLKGVAPLIELKIFNKSIDNIEGISIAFGFGNTYFGKGTPRLPAKTSEDGHYFYIKKKEHILEFLDYMAQNSSRSSKQKRLNLVKDFYKLKENKAHLPNAESKEKVAFEKLIHEWHSRISD